MNSTEWDTSHCRTYLEGKKTSGGKIISSICSPPGSALRDISSWITGKLVAARFLYAWKDGDASEQDNVALFWRKSEGTGYSTGSPAHPESLGITTSQEEGNETEIATAWWRQWALALQLSCLPWCSCFPKSSLGNRFSLAAHSAVGSPQQGQDTAKFAISQQPAPPWIPGPAVFWQRGSDPAWKGPQQTLGLEGSSPSNQLWNRSWFSFHVSSLVPFLQSKSEV